MLPPSHSTPPKIPSKPNTFKSQPDQEKLFQKVFRRLRLATPVPSFQVEFYPFTGVRHNIHLNENKIRVRLSDILKGAPPLVFEALAEILICRVYGCVSSREAQDYYRVFMQTPRIERQAHQMRRERGTKKMAPPNGEAHDLQVLFTHLNKQYFSGSLRGVKIGWSLRRSQNILGHYDRAHRVIIINRKLDSTQVPRFALEFIVYHEMLHLKFPPLHGSRRRIYHSHEFRKAEEKFPRFDEARKKLHLLR